MLLPKSFFCNISRLFTPILSFSTEILALENKDFDRKFSGNLRTIGNPLSGFFFGDLASLDRLEITKIFEALTLTMQMELSSVLT